MQVSTPRTDAVHIAAENSPLELALLPKATIMIVEWRRNCFPPRAQRLNPLAGEPEFDGCEREPRRPRPSRDASERQDTLRLERGAREHAAESRTQLLRPPLLKVNYLARGQPRGS
eukprot:3300523-Rhodomonas_salina.1